VNSGCALKERSGFTNKIETLQKERDEAVETRSLYGKELTPLRLQTPTYKFKAQGRTRRLRSSKAQFPTVSSPTLAAPKRTLQKALLKGQVQYEDKKKLSEKLAKTVSEKADKIWQLNIVYEAALEVHSNCEKVLTTAQ